MLRLRSASFGVVPAMPVKFRLLYYYPVIKSGAREDEPARGAQAGPKVSIRQRSGYGCNSCSRGPGCLPAARDAAFRFDVE